MRKTDLAKRRRIDQIDHEVRRLRAQYDPGPRLGPWGTQSPLQVKIEALLEEQARLMLELLE